MDIVVDASAIMAIIVKEPERDLVIELTKNAVIFSPEIITFEIVNALSKMMKKNVIEKERMLNAFEYFTKIPMQKLEIDYKKALEIAWDYKIYAYDACYLEVAKRLKLHLLTFDGNMINVGKGLGINILGGINASN